MQDCFKYEEDMRDPDFKKAHARKEELRSKGYRVKIRKDSHGNHVVYKKHVEELDKQRGYGNGRKRELTES